MNDEFAALMRKGFAQKAQAFAEKLVQIVGASDAFLTTVKVGGVEYRVTVERKGSVKCNASGEK